MKQALSFLGILNKAGKLRFGMGIEKNLARCDACVLAFDASPNTKKALLSALNPNAILLEGVSKEELGKSLGYDELSAVAVMDKKASKALKEKWGKESR